MGQRALIVVMDDGDDGRDTPGMAATVFEVNLETVEGAEEMLQALSTCAHSRDNRPATVRQWAQNNNLPVSRHGRIPVEIRKRFDNEHGQPADGE
jgi:hypothetical protein